jgi:hypothetical protein
LAEKQLFLFLELSQAIHFGVSLLVFGETVSITYVIAMLVTLEPAVPSTLLQLLKIR